MHVAVALLGPVQVRLDGTVMPLPSLPQRILLARLALAPGRVVGVGELLDCLWGDGPPANSLGNLQSYVSRLRRVLGSGLIAREGSGYRLDLAAEQVDVGEVQQYADQARAAVGQQPGLAAARFGQALGHWRGEALADLADRLAFAPDRVRLAEWRRQLRDEWFAARLAAGELAELLPELEQAAVA
ncbi:MAG TPA: BTAD domain-containing putative transcriptional regulator, partial [Micromonosporaceae bacterium]